MPESSREDRTSSSSRSRQGSYREAAEGPVHLPAPNEKCLVLSGPVRGFMDLLFLSQPPEAQTALEECFVCMNMYAMTLATVDHLGGGGGLGKQCLFSSPLPPPTGGS